ncbi:MAG: 3-hydroxyanthranilate 3,4-dioxygenase [Bradymonadia bacterium]|jgi:3-hydroxyanthranilate 3,4-dioxygenase
MAIAAPFDLKSWIDENRHLLKPPVGAQRIFTDAGFIVMVVGGPNQRSDYHLNEGEEFFYQLEGDMTLKVVDDGEFRDIPIKAGEVFLLPGGVPHSPQRSAHSVGLVVERPRAEHERDGLRWYCESCKEVVYEVRFEVEDFLGQMKSTMQHWAGDDELRKCSSCGHQNSPA